MPKAIAFQNYTEKVLSFNKFAIIFGDFVFNKCRTLVKQIVFTVLEHYNFEITNIIYNQSKFSI